MRQPVLVVLEVLGMGDITLLLARAREGDRAAVDGVFAALYPELRRIAHARLSRHVRNTLMDTTALVHECYMKFVNAKRLDLESRVHFLSYSATAMRSIIVDTARASLAERRGGQAAHVTLNSEHAESLAQGEEEIIDVDEALRELAKLDQRLVQVVEMRYFGGMTDIEIGQALGVTDRTVRRDWEKARLLLAHALKS
jgi:RNA polymerase sigma factor (TIGR02999 family)